MPESFEPVSFYSGINLILGEKDDTSNKTNGVGKTLLIEFINFCLLKEFKSSRVSKIPHSDFSKDILICLDFNIGDINIISQRSIGKHNEPTLIINGKTIEFSGVDDALSHLSNLTFKNSKVFLHPSFRSMLGPLIRDERSEFKSIVECFDTKLHIPADYTPHLYLLGIDISPYKEAKILQREIDDLSTTKNKIKKDIEFLTGSKISSAKAEVNDLKSKVEHIKKAMDALDSDSSYEMIKDEVAELESSLEELRNKRTILKLELSRINSLVGDVYINDEEVIEVYNKFKIGLGDAIKKELDDVISFKKKIDHFQHTLLNARKETLLSELRKISDKLYTVNKLCKEKASVFEQAGGFKSLKILIMTYQKKLEEYSQLSSLIKKFEEFDSKWKLKKSERSSMIISLDLSIMDNETTIESFEETILSMHEYVFGNRKCSFEIKATEKKETISMDLRIDDDGSHSNEREKVFFYDLALLLTEETFERHPGLLIHDNIFDVDQDTLIKSLNYLAEKSSCLNDAQYILTLNSDKISEIDKRELKLDINFFKRASLTKTSRFLGRRYQEKSRS
jgi:uncharacterized protein YydD (DUF2326 family)